MPFQTQSFSTQAEHHWRFLCLLAGSGRRRLLRVWQGRPESLRAERQPLTSAAAQTWLQQQLPEPEVAWQSLRNLVLANDIQVLLHSQLPAALRAIPDPPLALYVQGSTALLGQLGVAVVGARRCSATGAVFAERLAEHLAAAPLVVISGLALGIDAAAHRGAVRRGQTLAVLGSGLRNLHPKSHARLAQQILESNGAIVSEYLPTHPSYPGNFPERNRLISGLSRAVVVVEAGLRSGSLITARLALEQGREVLAVPGSVVSPVSAGCHRLLKQGAGLVTNVQDVFAALNLDPKVYGVNVNPGQQPAVQVGAGGQDQTQEQDTGMSAEGQVFAQLGGEPLSPQALAAATGFAVPRLLTILTRLELGGFVQRLPQGYIPSPD